MAEKFKDDEFAAFDQTVEEFGDDEFAAFDEIANSEDVPTNQEELTLSSTGTPSDIAAGASTGLGLEAARRASGAVGSAVERGLKDIAEDLAYSAIGGEKTVAGKKLLKDDLMGSYSNITPRSVGRDVLDKQLLGKTGLKSTEDAYSSIVDAFQGDAGKTNEFLKKIETKANLEDVAKEYSKALGVGKLDKTIPEDKSILDRLTKQLEEFRGERTASQLEEGKRKLQRASTFDPDKSVKDTMTTAQSRAYRTAVEDLVKNELGEEGLQTFKQMKNQSGKNAVIKNILEQKYAKDITKPTIGLMDLATAGTMGAPAALARKGITEHGAGIGAVASDKASRIGGILKDFAGSKVARAIPFLGGAAVGGMSAVQAAERGETAPVIAGEGALGVLHGLSSSLVDAVIPVSGGAPKNSPVDLFETGNITGEQYQQLKDRGYDPNQRISIQDKEQLLQEFNKFKKPVVTPENSQGYINNSTRARDEFKSATDPVARLHDKTKLDPKLVEHEGGQRLQAYQPDTKRSGVTVATGVDIGNVPFDSLELSNPLKSKLKDYRSITGPAAKRALALKPLELTQEEADELDMAVMKMNDKELERIGGGDLDENIRPAVLSLLHNAGGVVTKRFLDRHKAGDQESALLGVLATNRSGGKFIPSLLERRVEEITRIYPELKDMIDAYAEEERQTPGILDKRLQGR